MPKRIEMVGKTFNYLTVIGESRKRSPSGPIYWWCQCKCGNLTCVNGVCLRSGATKSCGCWFKEINSTHGKCQTKTYAAWRAMINRCHSPTSPSYEDYGGRGIKVCDRWRNSFENFLADMGESPEGLSLDRIDNDKGYFPENCRWADWYTQANNRRKMKYLGYSFRKDKNKWRSYIVVSGKQYGLGHYNKKEHAMIVHLLVKARLLIEKPFNMERVPKGYAWYKDQNKWVARITVDGKLICLKACDTEEEAHQVYLKAKERVAKGLPPKPTRSS